MKKMEESNTLLNVLCLEDELKDAELLNEMLVDAGYLVNMDIATGEKEYLSFLKGRNYDIILADYTLPGFDVHAALKLAFALQPEVPFICASGTISEDKAVELLKQGATDYVFKDRLGRIAFAVRRALEGVANQKKGKKAEEALRASEEKYRMLFEGSTLGILATDVETHRLLYSNPAICRMFGYLDEEFLRLTIPDLHPKGSMDLVISDFESLMRGEKVMSSTFPCLRKDGTVFYADIAGNSTIINGRKCSVGFFVDVTMRKQAEDAVRQSRKELDSLFEASPEMISFIGFDGYFKRLNPAWVKMLGYPMDKLLSLPFIEFVHPDDREATNAEAAKLAEGQRTIRFENRYRCNDGSYRWLAWSIIPDTKEKLLYAVARDITERKRAEQAILQSEGNFHRSISESPLGIRIVSVDGKTIYANKVFLDIYEFNSLEEFTSTPAINRYTPESYTQHQERKEKRKNGNDVFDYEVSIVRGNAEVRYVKVWRKEVLWNGTKHYQVINLDITEQKKLTTDLIAAKEQAEQSDRLKSAFLANMSHEIRTPMNGILGFAGLLKEPGLTGEEQQEYISIIEKSGARMLNIINDIVDISKIEAGLIIVNNKDTNINEKIEFIYIFFKPQVEEKGMQFFFKNTLPTKEATIRTDSDKFNSILTNLVKNAIKYSEVGTIEIGYIKRGETLEFYVKDTGIGIPKDRQSAIFERFIQADIKDKMARQGAGLGLSISKAYVEMLGGRIWVESEEGIGSTFYFTLPYNAEPEEKKVVEKVVPAKNGKNQIEKLKILIAEDDEISEKLISITVNKLSIEVIKSRTGNASVEICRKNPDIDLILMDIQMPDMNGYEATRQIRQFNKDVIIIAQTAFGLSGDREKAIEAGCNDYIAKPFEKVKLLALINKHFNL